MKAKSDNPTLKRERRILTQFSHPNIVHIHRVIHDGDDAAIAIEICPQDPLDWMQRTPSSSKFESINIFWHTATAVEYLHAFGISHGDLKLENILTTKLSQISEGSSNDVK
jgi:serine/threonine protein kinase